MKVSPTFTELASAVFTSSKSICSLVISTSSWSSSAGSLLLGSESGSLWSLFVTSAVLTIVPASITLASISKMAVAPTIKFPTVHNPVTAS